MPLSLTNVDTALLILEHDVRKCGHLTPTNVKVQHFLILQHRREKGWH